MPKSKKGNSKNHPHPSRLHAYWVVFLIWFFPPYAWHNMWKHKRYHHWFPFVMFLNYVTIFIPTVIYFLFRYPQFLSSGKQPIINPVYLQVVLVFLLCQLFYNLFLEIEVRKLKAMPKAMLIPTIAIFVIDYLLAMVITPIAIPFINLPLLDLLKFIFK